MDERLQINKVLKGDTSAFGYFVDTYQDMAITIYNTAVTETRSSAYNTEQNL